MVELSNQSQPIPGLRPLGTPCTDFVQLTLERAMPIHRLLLEGLDGAQQLHVQEQGQPLHEVGHRGRHDGGRSQ